MNFVSEKIADTAQGKRRYVFFSGDKLVSCHGCTGLDSLFVFTSADGKDWQLLAHKETEGGNGSWGKSSSEVKWLETGQGLWGTIGEGGYMQGGVSKRIVQILHDDGRNIRETVIPTSFENSGMADCDDEEYLQITKKGQAECYANESVLEATVEVRHDLPATGNTYPLQVTVNGYDGMKLVGESKDAKTQPAKEYKQEKFLFSYDANMHEYITPADYPSSLNFSYFRGIPAVP